MHHLYLVCILFGMPSLHLFTFLMFFKSCVNDDHLQLVERTVVDLLVHHWWTAQLHHPLSPVEKMINHCATTTEVEAEYTVTIQRSRGTQFTCCRQNEPPWTNVSQLSVTIEASMCRKHKSKNPLCCLQSLLAAPQG